MLEEAVMPTTMQQPVLINVNWDNVLSVTVVAMAD
jgi:hypothetical protein